MFSFFLPFSLMLTGLIQSLNELTKSVRAVIHNELHLIVTFSIFHHNTNLLLMYLTLVKLNCNFRLIAKFEKLQFVMKCVCQHS